MNPASEYADMPRTLDRLVVAVRKALTGAALHHAANALTGRQWFDHLSERTYLDLRTELAVDHLPDQAYPFTVRGVQQYPVWQTWRDHFKATYRLRWWAAWWVRRHPPRHRWTEVTVSQQITVPLRAAWKYPHLPAPDVTLGRPYLHAWTDEPIVDRTDSIGEP